VKTRLFRARRMLSKTLRKAGPSCLTGTRKQ
jgi:DNA-directed RNA polymerase specialized sigma24 family protein